ncbi:heterokaryon incompatibility protein-domain-containing protein [Paraphoma chrysanthemicola]|uniref:Heterokaryon incompatibility protein-domain-containing protein n=1 Tax=Paraphoma chrysanthemicola TaxID=798071 RepID=A0A8K0QZE7_9PLEO|nr:heterokaryon incompatibility protein-domain-containing protein [Paraphoma chrysanthemicola]
MPKTFQDAIEFTLKLNIRYLWIDSFCIIQDDLKDWEIESSKMADIYQQAVLTLAATASSGDTKGFFSEKSSAINHTEILLPGGRTSGIAIRQRPRHWNKVTANDPVRFPLLSRGWVLQERLLSPRILHFCASELVWECREESICECGGLHQDLSPGAAFYILTEQYKGMKQQSEKTDTLTTPRSLWTRVKSYNLGSNDGDKGEQIAPAHARTKSSPFGIRKTWLTSAPSPGSRATPARSILPVDTPNVARSQALIAREEEVPGFVHHYHRLVQQYMSLKLTRPTDRLAALSGICARMQHYRGDFLAGLWWDSLCFDLMWYVDRHALWHLNAIRRDEYFGPTWSWVTATSPIQYWQDVSNYKDTVEHFKEQLAHGLAEAQRTYTTPLILNRARIGYKIDVPGKNKFGSVTAGMLTVEASCVPALLEISYAGKCIQNKEEELAMDYFLLLWTDVSEDHAEVKIPFFADYRLEVDSQYRLFDDAELWLLLIHPQVSLVLSQAVQDGSAVYKDGEPLWQRIGIARLSEGLYDTRVVDWMRNSTIRTFKIV